MCSRVNNVEEVDEKMTENLGRMVVAREQIYRFTTSYNSLTADIQREDTHASVCNTIHRHHFLFFL